jgi:hypothetical protein
MNLFELQISAGALLLWLLGLLMLWKLADRPGRPGPIRSAGVIELMMLLDIMLLVIGVSLFIKGSGLFE